MLEDVIRDNCYAGLIDFYGVDILYLNLVDIGGAIVMIGDEKRADQVGLDLPGDIIVMRVLLN